ncbi:MAG: glycosyltransferase [Nitrososphaerales archaeon]
MRICIISTTVMTCPPAGYSGLEMVAWLQARGLSRRGHQVMLIAPIGSTPPDGVELHGTTLGESEQQAYTGYFDRLDKFDIIIDNSWEKWSYISKINGNLKAPILGVVHAPPDTMYKTAPPIPFPCIVAISKDQANLVSECWGVVARVAYNGVDFEFYRPMDGVVRDNERYLFLARMSKIKGPHIAIDVARRCRVGLDIVGDDILTGEPEYAQRIMAQARFNIKYHGPASRDKVVEWFSTRKALLHMNKHYREPFGLAPVEAQGCGMPVIAFDNGAMRETIKHGETGFIVKTEDEIVELIKTNAVADLNPSDCRNWALQFSVDNMINRYNELCEEAIECGW